MIHCIHKPDAIIFRKNLDNRRIHIKWHFILENITQLAFFILKDNFCSLICDLDSTSISRKWIFLFATVEDNHICIFYHIHKNGFHIRHIHLESTSIYTGNLLFYSPACRQLRFFKIAYQPHAIIFYDNTLRLMKNIHGNQSVCCKVFLIFNYLHNSIIGFKNCRIVFFLPFLTEDQKCLSIRMEIILLYGKTQERSLATFQETGH